MYHLPRPYTASSKPAFRYMEIYETMKQDIISGVLPEEHRLPSIRKQAEFLSVSTTPVELAYQQLIAEGFIESRPRKGYFVVKLPESYGKLSLNSSFSEGQEQNQRTGRSPLASSAVEPASLPKRKDWTYDFHLSKNDFSPFPFSIWKRLFNQLFQPETGDLLFYGEAQGEPGLRQEIASYLRQFRGVVCHPDRIVIAAEQHLLIQFLGQMLKHHGNAVAVEDPGYRIIPATLRAIGYHIHPIALDEEGLRPDLLRLSSARIASVSPSHQFPLGIVMPLTRRLELLEWAKETDGFLIEDDYGGEFRYQGRPVPSLQGLIPNDHVIYLGGFSQVLAPDFCIHYMVIPERLIPSFHELRRDIMFEASASRIHQRTLQLFMQTGYFEKHVRRMRNVYRKKNQQLTASIRNHFGSHADILGDSAGLHIILEVRSPLPEAELIALADQAGVRVSSAAFFWNKPEERIEKRFMIGFGGIDMDLIDEGIRLLLDTWAPHLL